MSAGFWTFYLVYLAAGLFATAAVLPYSLSMIKPGDMQQLKAKLAEKAGRLPAMLVILFSSVAQAGLIIAVAIFFGLQASRSVGLRQPVLEALFAGQPALPVLLSVLPPALLAGFAAGAGIIALEVYVFQPRLPAPFHTVNTRQAPWMRALACFYGGIYEELLLRLFALSGLIWLIGRAWPPPAGRIDPAAFWAANILAALLFGMGHLPATARIAPLTPLIIARALVLNGAAGLLCGVLFLRFGLESAMIAHFCMDIMILLVLPALTPAHEEKLQVQAA